MKNRFNLKLLVALLVALVLGVSAWAEDATVAPDAGQAQPPMAVTLPPVEALLATEAPLLEDAPRTVNPTPEATLAPIETAQLEDDGMLRLELRSLDGPRQLHLTLAGVYAVEGDPGFRFDRDTQLTLSVARESVWLAVGGLTIDMGPSLTLTRHRAEEGAENGIYIEESEKDTLYCGDLTVTAAGDMLRAVLNIQVEDYLYGVVPYEMSDSFPMEALKAQAVAARTYAMQRKWQAGRKDYDLVDTTADQVFKGYDPEFVNAIQAVDDTRGVVGIYDGTFAICYYTASNGGQTALPSQIWGREDSDGYLAMADDPYDLENPRSLQNELTVTAKCEGSAELKGMLEQALGERMAEEGYSEGEWQLDSIAAIRPVNPRFEGSRMYDGLEFELRARLLVPAATPEPTDTPAPTDTPEPTATPEATDAAESGDTAGASDASEADATAEPTPEATEEPTPEPTEVPMEWRLSDERYTVTLDVYGQIKAGLSLGLNGSDCELIDVATETDDAGEPLSFTLIMRRFGHGVGMSQRGAQWMAGHYDKTWREILAFYYPGLSLQRMSWPDRVLTDLEALPDSVGAARPRPTPTPTPVPLPALREGERYAVVTATSLNVRERPTTSSRAVDQLPKGRKVIVSSEPDADGWVSVRTGEVEGYVKEEYLEY